MTELLDLGPALVEEIEAACRDDDTSAMREAVDELVVVLHRGAGRQVLLAHRTGREFALARPSPREATRGKTSPPLLL
jgi:hypothetical protein